MDISENLTHSHQFMVAKFFVMGITFLSSYAAYFSYCLHNSMLSLRFLCTGGAASPSCASPCLKRVLSPTSGEPAPFFCCLLDHKGVHLTRVPSISTQLPLLNRSLQLRLSRYSGDVVCRCRGWGWGGGDCRIHRSCTRGQTRGLLVVREGIRTDRMKKLSAKDTRAH